MSKKHIISTDDKVKYFLYHWNFGRIFSSVDTSLYKYHGSRNFYYEK